MTKALRLSVTRGGGDFGVGNKTEGGRLPSLCVIVVKLPESEAAKLKLCVELREKRWYNRSVDRR